MLRVFLGLLLCLAGATAATAQIDCTKINTRAILEGDELDEILDCVEANPDLIGETDKRGYNLLMTAAGSEIDPLFLDDLLYYVPEDRLDAYLGAKDLRGLSLGHIAAAEALDPGIIFVLSAYGVSLMEEAGSEGGWLDFGTSPLHLAAAREDGWSIVAALLATGQEGFPDQNDRSPLDVALLKPGTTANAVLLSEGHWPERYRELHEPTEPASAAECSSFLTEEFFSTADEADVGACLTNGTLLESVDRDGNTVLHLAARYSNDPWIIDFILSKAVDPKAFVDRRNSLGMTALHLAAESGPSPEAVAHLLAWGADPNALLLETNNKIYKDRGISALHFAASRKDDLREDIILNLLAFIADTMVQDVSVPTEKGKTVGGRTPLHRAVLNPDPYVELMLLEGQFSQESLLGNLSRSLIQGHAVKQIVDDEGRTVLHMVASREADFDSLFALLSFGFSVDKEDNQGNTPLMYAAKKFTDPDLFLYLLEESENPCKSSKSGATVEAALRENKALLDVGAEDKSGMTLSPLAHVKQRCP